jgi:hypothetical protein
MHVNTLFTLKEIPVFWDMMPCKLAIGTSVLDEYTAYMFSITTAGDG